MLRNVVFYSSVAALILVILNVVSPTSFYNIRLSNMPTSLTGWHSRATPYSDPFTPERSALRLVILRNAPADPEGFTLALFDSPANIAVDAAGKVLLADDLDFAGLIELAERTKGLPPTGRFRNTWIIQQPTTSRPIERILLPITQSIAPEDQSGYEQTSVQGYDGVTTHLKQPVGDIQDLPPVLQDLVGLVLEAREGEGGPTEKDKEMVKRVKGILGDVF